MNTVTAKVNSDLDGYRYADAAGTLYDFAWNEFCSFFVEMIKGRLQDEATAPVAQRVLVHVLDSLLRLLHPMVPFVTEEVWQQLAKFAPERGLTDPQPAAESIMVADWPEADASRVDATIEEQFARFQDVLKGLREIRNRQAVPPKKSIHFSVRCEPHDADLLKPMEKYFERLAGAEATGWGPDVVAPEMSANFSLPGIEVFVDLAELIDVEAELAKKEKERQSIEGMITGKGKKLSNASFVERAPAEVVERERAGLVELKERLAATEAAIETLKKSQ